MKNRLLLLILYSFLVSCTGSRQQKQNIDVASQPEMTKDNVLKGEVISIDTALFRYAYRVRVQGERAVVFDLHNRDYYFHVFTYPDFKYLSSFGKRGEGPEELIYGENVRFAGEDSIWVLDSGKGALFCYGGITKGEITKLSKTVLLDKSLLRALDFDFYDALTMVIPDYTGENRFCWVDIDGKLVRKSESISDLAATGLEKSPMAVAQGWRSFISFSPDKQLLVAVTQFGEVLDIYDMQTHRHIRTTGQDGEPEFNESSEGYGVPSGRLCYWDVPVTDNYIYAVYDGCRFKDLMKEVDHKQGGKLLRVFDHHGTIVKEYLLDRPIAGLYVDEVNGTMIATDVNADEQIVMYRMN